MTAYGYRLHQVLVHPARKQSTLDMSKVYPTGDSKNSVHAIELLLKQLTGLVDHPLVGSPTYLTDRPQPLDDGEPEEGAAGKRQPMLFLRRVSQHGRRLELLFDYGVEGDYETLLDVSGESSPMTGKAGGRGYRLWLVFPEAGNAALMVSEVKGRTHVGEVLFHWLRCMNQREAVTFDEAGNRVEAAWLRWTAHPMFDPERFARIEADASNFTLTLTRKAKKADGGPDEGTVKVTESGLGVERIGGVMALMLNWWHNRQQGTKGERSRRGAEEVEALVNVKMSEEFDDGEISFKENNKQQSITPNTVDRLFIYPLGEVPPSSELVLETAKLRLPPILSALDMNIELDASM